MLEKLFIRRLNVKNITFSIVAILFLIFVVTCKDIAIMFFASFVIACSINPIVDKMEKKMPRNLAATIVLFLLTLIILAVFIPVCIISTEEIKAFAVSFPKHVDMIDDYIAKIPFVTDFHISTMDMSDIASSASASSADMINNIINIGKNIGSAFVYLIVSVIIIFNMVADKERIKNFYIRVFPSNMRKRAIEIGKIISEKMGGYLIALSATMLGVGLVMAVGLGILGIKYALILALITAVLDIIPVVGPGLALIIGIVTTYEHGAYAVISVISVFTAAQLIENNFVRPYVFGKFLDLHPLVIFLFLFIAAKFMGVVGVIFAPAVAALVAVMFEELYLKNLD